MCFGVSHAHVAAFPCWSVACWGGAKDKAPEPNRNKISVLDARLLGSVQDPKRRSLSPCFFVHIIQKAGSALEIT